MLEMPRQFPASDYTPFGYLDNPAHSAIFNRSGAIRSVPPLGFGFFARSMPWSYGDGLERQPGYISLLDLSLNIEGTSFQTSEDFHSQGVEIKSQYHTKNLMSYDWDVVGLHFSARYCLPHEHALVCFLDIENRSNEPRSMTVHATNIYGAPGHKYWGRDGLVAQYNVPQDVGVTKVWAYGDVFVLGANRPSQAHKATVSRQEWRQWIASNDLSCNEKALASFRNGPDHTYNLLSYNLHLPPGAHEELVFCLARGTNEAYAVDRFQQSLHSAHTGAAHLLADDAHFYEHAPLLEGDWPASWKHGWIYDLETIRMTIRPPLGIFQHPWDGMQIYTPRSVLGEMSMDTLLLSYADVELAKDVIYGTFADAPCANIPCTREDGSMNMISESGAEDGTGPNWGLPFLTIQSIYLRDHDDHWLRKLYPHLKTYLEWWLANRTDADGWVHADCSWETGQDGSRRFLQTSEGGSAAFVRTVDIEAAMAHAMQCMVNFAEVAGLPTDAKHWEEQARQRREHVSSMYHDGWFYDIDARNGQPIIQPGYYDIMMLYPLTLGLASPEQVDGVRPMFHYFQENPKPWLEWPPSIEAIVEAAWWAEERAQGVEIISRTANRIYARLDAHQIEQPPEEGELGLAERYGFRIPGIASEYWPLSLEPGVYRGGESYGWGATLPMHILRSLIGFRESLTPGESAFTLVPLLPQELLIPGRRYGVRNLRYRNCHLDLEINVVSPDSLSLHLTCRLSPAAPLQVTGDHASLLFSTPNPVSQSDFSLQGENGAIYKIQVGVVGLV